MKAREAMKQEAQKIRDSVDDIKNIMAALPPEQQNKVRNDMSIIRESADKIESMIKKAGDMEI
jgi:hypothetical protein